MNRHAIGVFVLLATACSNAAEPNEVRNDCERATSHVADCYGAEMGAAFAESCTEEAAATALAETCATGEPGKADLLSTNILSPPIEQFKYGSIGSDILGLPEVLLRAMPLVCEDHLPPDADPRDRPLRAFGFIYEPGKDLPIGFSKRRLPLIGVTLVGNTCSACHTSTVRETVSSARSVYFGAPNVRFDVERFNQFLFNCMNDKSRFNAWNLNKAFNELGIWSFERFIAFKGSIISAFVSGLEEQVNSVVRDGPWGPGRDDAIGLSAAILLGPEFLPSEPAPVDYPAVWNQKARAGQFLHWDGASGSAEERNILVSVGAGTPRHLVPIASIAAIQNWLEDLPPPAYPFAVNQALAAQGAPLYQQHCAKCHDPGPGSRLWQVIELGEIGTDPNRVTNVTQVAVDEMNSLSGKGWKFDQFRRTNGYLASLLDGVWLRSPYLHNGSVPTLRDLLRPASERPSVFYRGNDVYDQKNVGFVSNVAQEGGTQYTRIETWRKGGDNGGHEYGTSLSEAERDALLEYLKTL